jgi:uncharacterized membrane protein YjjP (DUF1212 family)
MTQKKQKKVLILALLAGEIMLRAGAEIYRVEDTIRRICKACKVDYVECYATPTGIFLSLDSSDKEKDMHTFIKRIESRTTNLNKISQVNHFSRVFTTTSLSVDDGFEMLRQINNERGFPTWLKIIGAILVGAFYTPFYGGGVPEIVIGALSSAAAYMMSVVVSRFRFAEFVNIFIGAVFAATIPCLFAIGLPELNAEAVIIGATTIFLPGVAITNAARDILSGDAVSGTARAVDAFMTAIAIALGVGITLKFVTIIGAEVSYSSVQSLPPWLLATFGIPTTLGFAFVLDAPKKLFPLICLVGGLGQCAYILMTHYGGYGSVVTCFCAACIIAIVAELCSRAGKDATTVFIIPAIIPLVPGSQMFQTMLSVINYEISNATTNGMAALFIAGAIALALVAVASVTRLFRIIFENLTVVYSKRRK